MRVIKASEFKAKCLKIMMDEVAATGETEVITKHGIPITDLVPTKRRPGHLFGVLKESVAINGDIVAPANSQWNGLA